MSARGLILAYHAIEDGPPPLFVSAELFRLHVEAIAKSPATVVTLDHVLAGDLPEHWVALTFDDGYSSVARNAAPVLAAAGFPATVFCVAGRIGADNRWPGQAAWVPSRPLATSEELAELAAAGWAIGSHGMDHAPLDRSETLERELVESRALLQGATGAAVDWFAYPYGAVGGGDLVASTYRGAVAMGNRFADAASPPHALPRVDAHYLRRPALLSRALAGERAYVALRRSGARLTKKRSADPLRKDEHVAGAFAPSQDELSSAEHYDLIADDYDAPTVGGHRRRARMNATIGLIGPGPGVLLDIGVGSGQLIPPLLEAGWTVHGVDPAPAMLEHARKRAPGAATRLIHGRAEELPYEDNSFDVVVALAVLEYTDMERSVPEIARVLRPGGRAVLCVRNGRAPSAVWRRHVIHPLARAVKARRQVGRRRPLRRRPPLSPARGRAMLGDAGLAVRSTELAATELLPDPLDAVMPRLAARIANAAERSRPLRSMFGSQRVYVAEKEL